MSTRDSATEVETNALAAQAHASTYRLVDLTDPSSGGTAVAVSIGSRYFLATAAHVIPAGHRLHIVLRDSIGGIDDFVARHIDAEADVGLLELTPGDAARLGDTFVPDSRISTYGDQQTRYDITVIGYPGKLIHEVGRQPLSPDATLQVWQVNAFTFFSQTLPRSEWPTADMESVPDAGRDIFIGFDPEERLYLQNSRTAAETPIRVDAPAPHPAGISGGGIWLFGSFLANGVWRPSVSLHGIQFSKGKSWLRGTLIGAWLDLVHANYPDLRPAIENIRQRPIPAAGT